MTYIICIGFIQSNRAIDWFNQGLEYEEWRLFQNLTRVAKHQLLDKAEDKEVRQDGDYGGDKKGTYSRAFYQILVQLVQSVQSPGDLF